MAIRGRKLSIGFIAAALAATGCASQQVMLQAPGTGSGQRFRCGLERACEPAEVDTPVRESMPDAVYIELPAACEGRFHQLIIYEAESSEPEVGVTCATSAADAQP